MGGLMRMVGIIAVLALAAFGMLAVFDIIPREQLADYGLKTFIAIAIVAVAVVAITVLARRS